MNKMLEDKVSHLMATKEENHKEIENLNNMINSLKDDKNSLIQKIESLEGVISDKDVNIVDLKNRIDDLET